MWATRIREVGAAVRRRLAPSPVGRVASLDRELRHCRGVAAAVAVLENSREQLACQLRLRLGSPAAEAVTLKVLNTLLARHHFRARSTALFSRPIGLVVDPSNMCRLACPGCVHSANASHRFDWANGSLAQDRFAALLQRYGPHAIGVYFCNYGEPLLNLETPTLIRMAKGHLLWTGLSTSLSVPRFDAEAYVRSGLDFMAVSIDGATQPVYERFRRNGSLELVLENVRKLVDAKRRLGRRTPVVSWNMLAFEHNAHEIERARRIAAGMGVDEFRVAAPFDVAWDDPGIRPTGVRPRVDRLAWDSAAAQAENWNPFPGSLDAGAILRAFEHPWEKPPDREAPPQSGRTCRWLYTSMTMDAAGRIMPCCGAPRPDANLVFGALEDTADPFNSERYRQARASFRGIIPYPAETAPYCAGCEWDHDNVNIDGPRLRRYFRAADPRLFDRAALRILANW